jgi:hypothetical protein
VTILRRAAIAGAGVAAVAVLLVAAITLGHRLGAVPWPRAGVPSGAGRLEIAPRSPGSRQLTPVGAGGTPTGGLGGPTIVTPVAGGGGLSLAGAPRPPSAGRRVVPVPRRRHVGRAPQTVGRPGPGPRAPTPAQPAPAAANPSVSPVSTPSAPAAGSGPAQPVALVASAPPPSTGAQGDTPGGKGDHGGSQGQKDGGSQGQKDGGSQGQKNGGSQGQKNGGSQGQKNGGSQGQNGSSHGEKSKGGSKQAAVNPHSAAVVAVPNGGGHGSHGDGGGHSAAGGGHGDAPASDAPASIVASGPRAASPGSDQDGHKAGSDHGPDGAGPADGVPDAGSGPASGPAHPHDHGH